MRAISMVLTLGVLMAMAAEAPAHYARIVVDGDVSDWAEVPVVAVDAADDDGGGPDLATLQIANDDTHLYLLITYHAEVNPNAGPSVMLALDNDVMARTGFDIFGLGIVGAEAGWQNDFPFQQARDIFNSGSIPGGGAAIAPYNTMTSSQEYAIPLSIVFEAGGGPVFPETTFRLLVYTDPTAANEIMGPVTYTLSK